SLRAVRTGDIVRHCRCNVAAPWRALARSDNTVEVVRWHKEPLRTPPIRKPATSGRLDSRFDLWSSPFAFRNGTRSQRLVDGMRDCDLRIIVSCGHSMAH